MKLFPEQKLALFGPAKFSIKQQFNQRGKAFKVYNTPKNKNMHLCSQHLENGISLTDPQLKQEEQHD